MRGWSAVWAPARPSVLYLFLVRLLMDTILRSCPIVSNSPQWRCRLAHICLQQSAMPHCYILQLSCSWLLTRQFCNFLQVFSMRQYTILIIMSPPDSFSTCIPQLRLFIWLTTATTSTIGCSRDMPGSASWLALPKKWGRAMPAIFGALWRKPNWCDEWYLTNGHWHNHILAF